MKRFLILLLALAMALPSASRADADSGKIVNGLLSIGIEAIRAEQQRRADKRAAAGEKATEPSEEAPAERRTWKDRGKNMLGAFAARYKDDSGDVSQGQLVGLAFKDALDVVVDEYKEQYKKEGREYAKELGDKLVERVREDPKISASITSVQILCWVTIAYLTVVTLIMLFSLLRLKRINGQLMKKLDQIGKGK